MNDNRHSNEFYWWKTRFDECAAAKLNLKRQFISSVGPIARRISAGMFGESEGNELLRLGEEYLWLGGGKPYYNVHPKLVSHLVKCNLGAIPASFLEIPGGFDAVLIRFAGIHPDLQVNCNEHVRSVLISRFVGELSDEEFHNLFARGQRPKSFAQRPSSLRLNIDLGEKVEPDGIYTVNCTLSIHLGPDLSLADGVASFETERPELIAPGTRRREVLENVFRVVATVGLIANSPEDRLLQYDVLAKDRQEFAHANEQRRQFLIDRARRRGKLGWNVGTNELFIGQTAPWTAPAMGEAGREHTHAHIRTGHLHAVRFGPGRRQVKIKWFRPTVVRPDLPFETMKG